MRKIRLSSVENLTREQLLSSAQSTSTAEIAERVQAIIKDVKQRGDAAVFEYTERFDQVKLSAETLKVSENEFSQAAGQVSASELEAIKTAIERIKKFHAKQKRCSWFDTEEPGVVLGQIVSPIEKVGLYVPGGSAPLVSTVIMNAVPALIAGVEKLYLVTPPNQKGQINPALLLTADLLGIKDVFKIGGAQAVAALALGTDSVPRVDKIVGPGNIYVATAKQLLFGQVDIDMIAGPSEILVLADKTANPGFIAADLLSQAEHDPLSGSYLVSDSEGLIAEVEQELERQLRELTRADIASKALKEHGLIVEVPDLVTGAAVSNLIAPEHLIVETDDPWSLLGHLRNAGAIFLGHFTPEAVGDYLAGPNHVLPTQGTARFFSPLGVDDFIKKSSLLSFGREQLRELSAPLLELAGIEGLSAHANSVKIRLGLDQKE